MDAVDQVCGTHTSFTGLPPTFRAVDVPHEGYASYFLDTFDRPKRVTACECERLLFKRQGGVSSLVDGQSGRVVYDILKGGRSAKVL